MLSFGSLEIFDDNADGIKLFCIGVQSFFVKTYFLDPSKGSVLIVSIVDRLTSLVVMVVLLLKHNPVDDSSLQ